MKFGKNYAFNHALEQDFLDTNFASKKGIGLKTLLLMFIMVVFSTLMMSNFNRLGAYALMIYACVVVTNFILQLIICFVPRTTKVLSVPYAACEGLTIGTLIGIVELVMPGEGVGLAGLALILTISVFLAASILYVTGVIVPNRKFRGFMLCVVFGIAIATLIITIISIFNYSVYSLIFSNSVGILVSVILVIIAGLYVVISLDNANQIVENCCPKVCEWYAAYGILINVEWLFLEIFRLLIRLASSNRK